MITEDALPLKLSSSRSKCEGLDSGTSWVAAVAGGLFGIFKILTELRHTSKQRAQDLRWRKAQAATSLNDEMMKNEQALAAMQMLEWEHEFEIKQGIKKRIYTADMLASLRIDAAFSDLEMFARDAFYALLYYLGFFEHYVS